MNNLLNKFFENDEDDDATLIVTETNKKTIEEILNSPQKPKFDECNIYIDTQEKKVIPVIVRILYEKFKRVNLWVRDLTVGDILIVSPDMTQEVNLERKTPDDLASSMKDGRSETQMPDLAEHPNGFLVIVGDPYDETIWERTNFTMPDSATRYLTKMQLETNIDGNRAGMMRLPDHEQLAVQIDYIATVLEEDRMVRSSDISVLKPKFGRKKVDYKDKTVIQTTQLHQLAVIGKINVKIAKRIMDHFEWNYKKIQNATIGELKKVDKVGPVLAERIFVVYNT